MGSCGKGTAADRLMTAVMEVAFVQLRGNGVKGEFYELLHDRDKDACSNK